MRITPDSKYLRLPCSYVGTGCAYEDYYEIPFPGDLPDGLKGDGYLTLEAENRYIRQFLPIRKKVYYRRRDRIKLGTFLARNTARCCVCVLGHFVYVNGKDYWSFFDNENDDVVCVWYLKEKENL